MGLWGEKMKYQENFAMWEKPVSRIQNSYHFESLDKTKESTDLAQYL